MFPITDLSKAFERVLCTEVLAARGAPLWIRAYARQLFFGRRSCARYRADFSLTV